MNYSRVYIDSLGYELPAEIVTSRELDQRLIPMYEKLHLAPSQLEALTGIAERRWWDEGYPVSQGAAAAVTKALQQSNVRPKDVDVLIYAGVCRENFEPATACAVADAAGIHSDACIYDISNACLGVLNGIIDVANRIELGQIKAGVVVSCESSRQINEIIIQRLLDEPTMPMFTTSLATLTGGSGAVAVVITDGSFDKEKRRKLMGGAYKAAPEHHDLCKWGVRLLPISINKLGDLSDRVLVALDQALQPETIPMALKGLMTSERIPRVVANLMPSESLPKAMTQFMATDSVAVLRHGVELGARTWGAFLKKLGWAKDQVDKIVCHQVGAGHRNTILQTLGIPAEKDYSTYRFLGNMGTVSLPLTAALAEKRSFLNQGDRVGFLGIGSGLNCLMLGLEW